ncbi:MAG: OsmC family protein [candidate division KSB1 bacterium]|nr:OsmC family protein [candidate division KSB1 bacterium]
MKTSVSLNENMHFTAKLDGFEISMDAGESVGGQGKGVKPKGLTLVSLAGCTGMDVISILRKMRAEPETFSINVEAETSDEHPKVYTTIKVIYRFKGGDITRDKAEKAVQLSQEKYCGVSAMLKKAATIDYEIIIED